MYKVIVKDAEVPIAFCTNKVAAERVRDDYRVKFPKEIVEIVWEPNRTVVSYRSFQP